MFLDEPRKICIHQNFRALVISIISKNNNNFKDEISAFKKYKISLNIKAGTVLKFYKPRSIYLGLKDKI
jgi:hypothetical protein